MNCALIYSNALTVKGIIKLAPTNVFSGNITSIESGTQKNIKKSKKSESNQFTQL